MILVNFTEDLIKNKNSILNVTRKLEIVKLFHVYLPVLKKEEKNSRNSFKNLNLSENKVKFNYLQKSLLFGQYQAPKKKNLLMALFSSVLRHMQLKLFAF